ncbi:hypothetical protein MMC12_001120 [Toensbergia leucococca]|nr:hypothetical protein [Toensbergia leucococca]
MGMPEPLSPVPTYNEATGFFETPRPTAQTTGETASSPNMQEPIGHTPVSPLEAMPQTEISQIAAQSSPQPIPEKSDSYYAYAPQTATYPISTPETTTQPATAPPYAQSQPQQLPQQQQQSQYRTATPLYALNSAAAPVDCPCCGARALTRIEFEAGNTTHAWAAALCCVFCIGCVPYLMASLKDVTHRCGSCGVLLATWKRSGNTLVHQQG